MSDENSKNLIGYWGFPHPDMINSAKAKYTGSEFIDLDVNYNYPSSNIIPDAYCRIIRNIVDNSIFLKNKLECILASVGEEKCDSGRFASLILKDMGFNIIETKFENYEYTSAITPICKSNLSLKNKINHIMNGVIENKDLDIIETIPTHGFWGVPPNDFDFLDLFPTTTHVYGWTRCVEAKRPADMEIEMYVDENIPTVFFAQTFCSKMQLAKYLAQKYDGLYIDVDDFATNSVKAKIEAFIRLG
ncbi:MAG: hypothetical protein WC197_02195 [Candidatus Gastranaerophilaceae bacterium]|jgi:hypothetical protein